MRHDFSLPTTNQSNRRRLYVFLGTLAVTLVASLGYTWLRPAEYRASARLEITPATGTVPSGPTEGSAPESPRPFLTETQILTSRPVLELAATRLERAGQRYPAVGPDPVADMQSHLEAVPIPNTNVVELVATGPRLEVLAPMLNTIIEAYRDHLAEAYRDSSAESLVQANEEVRKLEESVAAKRREVEAFRLRNNIVSLEREENQILSQTRDLSASLSAANERVAKAEAKLHALTDSAAAGKTVVRSKERSDACQPRAACLGAARTDAGSRARLHAELPGQGSKGRRSAFAPRGARAADRGPARGWPARRAR